MTVERKVDEIIEWTDDLFLEGKFAEVDDALEKLNVVHIPTVLLIVWLGTTLCAKEHLPSRVGFFQRVKDEIFEREGRIRPGLLDNLG